MKQAGKKIAKRVRIGYVQTEPEFGAVDANLGRAGRFVSEAPPFDVLVLPELFSTGYLFADREECRRFSETVEGPTVSRCSSRAGPPGRGSG